MILDLLLSINPFLLIFVVSIIVSLFSTLIYKWTTDQNRLKSLRKELKDLQKKIQKVAKEKPEKALALQQEMSKLSLEQMKSSFKPMIFTIIPLLLVFGWLGAHYAFDPLAPGEQFNLSVTLVEGVSGSVSLIAPDGFTIPSNTTREIGNESVLVWRGLRASEEGTYEILVRHDPSGEEQYVSVIISSSQRYLEPINLFPAAAAIKEIRVGLPKLLVFNGIPLLGDLPWIKTFGWFGAYFLFSFIFSILLRKLLKIA